MAIIKLVPGRFTTSSAWRRFESTFEAFAHEVRGPIDYIRLEFRVRWLEGNVAGRFYKWPFFLMISLGAVRWVGALNT
jgi:hypothetical protein